MYFAKTLVVLSVALSAMASPHMARGVNHRALAHRNPAPVAEPEPVVVAPIRKRANSSRCKTRASSSAAATSSSVAPSTSSSATPSSTSAVHSSSSIAIPQNVESSAVASTEAPATTTQQATTTTKAATSTKHSTTAQATTSASSSSSSDDPLGILTGTHTGDGTYYETGLGACGITNSDTDFIAAVSHTLFDNYPGYDGVNPNNNPLCGKKIKATYNGNSVTVAATDRCVGCDTFALDFSPSAFEQLASFDVGRFHDMTWVWV